MNIGIKYLTDNFIFDKRAKQTNSFSDGNNIYLSVENTAKSLGVGYSTPQEALEYSIKNDDNKYLSVKYSYCDEKKCIKKGFMGDKIKIDGYILDYSEDYDERLIFKIQYITNKKLNTETRCYTTIVNSRLLILTYSPEKKRLVLAKNFTGNPQCNIVFVTDDSNLYKNLLNLNLNPYGSEDEKFIYLSKDFK